MKKILDSEVFRYCLNGGATTVVNYVIYFLLIHFSVNYLAANTIAWAGAVLFAYGTNRLFVFHSNNSMARELFSFFTMRFATLLLENLLLWLFLSQLGFSAMLSKVGVSIFTVAANYIVCKCSIFRKGVVSNE